MSESEVLYRAKKSKLVVLIELLIVILIVVIVYSIQLPAIISILSIATFFALNISGGKVYTITGEAVCVESYSLYTSLDNRIEFENIVDIDLKQGKIAALLNIGSVYFINAEKGKYNIKFAVIDNPEKAIQIVNDIRARQ